MDVHVVTELGSWISYGKDDVAIAERVYTSVPVADRVELESVAAKACEEYHRIVKETKDRGEKPKASSIKKLTMEPFKKWVQNHQVGEIEKVVRSTVPRIPRDNEVPRVIQKQSYFSDTNPTTEEIESMFNNFDSESLSDEAVVNNETDLTVDLDADLFEDGDLLDGLDDF